MTSACFLVKVIPEPIHGDDCYWAGVLWNSIAFWESAFSDVILIGIEEEGNGKTCVWSLTTAFFCKLKHNFQVYIFSCLRQKANSIFFFFFFTENKECVKNRIEGRVKSCAWKAEIVSAVAQGSTSG